VVSFIGYLSQEVKVTGNFLNITLENNTELLDESMAKLPSMLVITPVVVPFTTTLAPITGSPILSTTLVVSFIGYLSQEVKVTGNFLNITLENNTELLDEVVVVGYGVQKKANLTGAIATVGAKELEDRPVTNAAAALQGKVANLNISNGDGGPGKKASFNIRGYAGLDATYSPLVIIDGVTGYFDDLNPNDIETLTVLKDAAASNYLWSTSCLRCDIGYH